MYIKNKSLIPQLIKLTTFGLALIFAVLAVAIADGKIKKLACLMMAAGCIVPYYLVKRGTNNQIYLENPKLDLQFLIACSFIAMLLAGVTIPSDGNHGLFSAKSLSFLMTAGSLGLYILAKKRLSVDYLKTFGFLLAGFTFFLFWSAVGLIRNLTINESISDQAKLFLLTLLVVIFTYIIVKEEIVSFSTFMKTLIYANFVYSFFKCFLVVLHFLKIINFFDFMEKTGMRFMSMDMGTGMIRLQTSVDMLSPFLVFFVLQAKPLGLKFPRYFQFIYLIISAFSIFLSFSRVLMFIGFLSLALFWFTLEPSRLIKSIFLCAILGALAIASIGINNVSAMIEKRLFSNDNYYSDRARTEQIEGLMKEYDYFPYLGKGMGGYTRDGIRDGKIPHSYEVQWVAFLMQFGIVGVLALLSALSIIARKYLTKDINNFSRMHLASFALFGCWLLAGFTNPYLISLTSGIIYAIFLLVGIQINKSKNIIPALEQS